MTAIEERKKVEAGGSPARLEEEMNDRTRRAQLISVTIPYAALQGSDNLPLPYVRCL